MTHPVGKESGLIYAPKPRSSRRLLAEVPEQRHRRYCIISVDDHVLEPPTLFDGRLPAQHRDRVPKPVDEQGVLCWSIDDQLLPIVSSNALISWSEDQWELGTSTTFDEVMPGAWNIDARVRDMDINGVYASLSFPSMCFGFAGQKLSAVRDATFAKALVMAYNDWVFEEWYSPYPDRIIPCQVVYLGSVHAAVTEVERNAQRGFRAVAFTENPEKLGYKSIHSGEWDPFFAACEATGTVINLHVGSSSTVTQPSSDSPNDVVIALLSINSIVATADWLFSKIAVRFPDLRIVLSEGGVDWLPMMLSRLKAQERLVRAARSWEGIDLSPTEILLRNFRFAALWDTLGPALVKQAGASTIMLEVDYPHADSTYPDSQLTARRQLDGVTEQDAEAISFRNAASLYGHPLPNVSAFVDAF